MRLPVLNTVADLFEPQVFSMRAALVVASIALAGLIARAPTCLAQSSQNSNNSSQFGSKSSSQSSKSNSSLSGNLTNSASQAMNDTSLLRSSRSSKNFVGANQDFTRDFLSADDSPDQSNRGGQSRATNRSRANQTGSNRNSSNGNRNNSRRGNSRGGQSGAEFMPTYTLGFEHVVPERLDAQLTARIQQVKHLALPAPIQLEYQAGVATLRGTVASEHDRLLAAQLLALEPGVRRVDNQLKVVPPEAASQPAPQK